MYRCCNVLHVSLQWTVLKYIHCFCLRFDDGNAFLDDKSHIEDLKTRLIVEDFDQYEVYICR